jgi:hypothetical protein
MRKVTKYISSKAYLSKQSSRHAFSAVLLMVAKNLLATIMLLFLLLACLFTFPKNGAACYV